MSLILDALKEADAERALGRAPGLQAQPMPLPGGDLVDDDGGTGRRLGVWIGAGSVVVLAAAAGAAWWAWGRAPTGAAQTGPVATAPQGPAQGAPVPQAASAPAPAPAPQAAALPQVPAVAAVRSPSVAPKASASTTRPAAAPVATPAPPRARPERPATTTAAVKAPAPARGGAAAGAASATTATSDAGSPAARRAPADSPPVAPALESLPDELRRSVPPLAVGGSIYADRPADRVLIVNGQLLKEGDMVDGRLVLEGIGRQGATWRLGDQRFSTRF